MLHERFCREYEVAALRCSRPECPHVLPYDGREHAVTPLFLSQRTGVYYGMNTYDLLDLTRDHYASHSPFVERYKTMVQEYAVGGFSPLLPPRSTLLRGVQDTVGRVIVPYMPLAAEDCRICGPYPDTVVTYSWTNSLASPQLCPFFATSGGPDLDKKTLSHIRKVDRW